MTKQNDNAANHDNTGNYNRCNIVKDLLPLYLEDLCSEDTRNFVEAHLEQCTDCQNTCSLLKHAGPDTDAVQDQEINAFKKLNAWFSGQMLTGYLLFLAVLGIGIFTLLLTVHVNQYYFESCALLMPLTIFATDFVFHGKSGQPDAGFGRALLIPQCLMLLFSMGMMFYVMLSLYLTPDSTPLGVPLSETGPILAALFWAVTILSLIVLALYLHRSTRNRIYRSLLPAVSILCIFLNLTYHSMLYRMSSPDALILELVCNTLILCAVSVSVLLITGLFHRSRGSEKPFG